MDKEKKNLKQNKLKINRRTKNGIVVSDKMNKTVVVKVDSYKLHPIYKKRYRVSTKYKAHSKDNIYKIGDKVLIEETRP